MIFKTADYYRDVSLRNCRLNSEDLSIAINIFKLIQAVSDGGELGVYISDKEYNYRIINYLKSKGFTIREKKDSEHSGITIDWSKQY